MRKKIKNLDGKKVPTTATEESSKEEKSKTFTPGMGHDKETSN